MDLLVDQWDDADDEPLTEAHAAETLDATCEKIEPTEVTARQTNLTPRQRLDLAESLSKFDKLFDGSLGLCPDHKIHLDIEPNAIPVHSQAHSVPRAHWDVFRNELQHLVSMGVLRPCGATEWAAPSMVIPKKDKCVR